MDVEYRFNREFARGVGDGFLAFAHAIEQQAGSIGAAIQTAQWSVETTTAFLELNERSMGAIVGSYSWVDPEGRVLASSHPRAAGLSVIDRPYFQAVLREQDWAISDLIRSRADQAEIVVIARAIKDQKAAVRGVVLVEIRPDRLGSVLRRNRPGSGRFALFDRAGRLVYRGGPSVGASQGDPGDPMVFQALSGKEVDGEFQPTHERNTHLGSRVPITEIGWVAGASRPKPEVIAPVYTSASYSIIAAVLVLAAAILMATLLNRRILRGVDILREHAALLGAGHLEHRVDLPEIQELGELAKTFNRMAEQIMKHQRAVKRTNQELLRSNRELESFSYSVSHDLRAPLRAIDGFSLAIVEDYSDRLDDEGRRLLNIIRTNAQRLERLIDDLLAYSRVGRKRLEFVKVNVGKMVRDAFSEQTAALEEVPSLELGTLPEAFADPTLLRQAFANLLGNAVKFTKDRPSPRIRVSGSANGEEIIYSVEDNGVGFDMRYAGKLFGVFQRLHRADEFEGTGVGLAIVEQIVKRHGGRVWAEAEINRGATFHIALPQNQAGETHDTGD